MLFLDEPSTGLDPQNRANLWDHVRALRERGTTIFLTTHYLEEADALCDRLVIMDHGEIVIDGTPRELKRQVAGESVVLSLREYDGGGERASALLAAQPFVREVTADGRPGPPVRRGRERRPAPDPPAARRRTASAVRSMSLSEPTLDDVFLRQTGRSLRDAGASGERSEAA